MTPAETADLVGRLARAGYTVATAESLTGGGLADAVVAVPGASVVFRGGVIAYATDLKASLLGVDAGLLAARGAVDAGVAAQMAAGVRARLGADIGLATTGVAGPGPQDGHPAGTVFIAVCGAGKADVRELALAGDRTQIRRATIASALDLLAEFSHSQATARYGREQTGPGAC